MAWIGQGSLQLDEESLEADPQLQRRLAVAAGVKVGTGAEQQRLAGVELLAAAEDGGDPFLWAQILLAPLALGAETRPDVDPSSLAEAPVGGLFAAGVAKQHSLRSLRGELHPGAGIGGADGLGVQRPV